MRYSTLALLLTIPATAFAHEGHKAPVAEAVFASEALHPAAVTVTDQTGSALSFRDEVIGEGPVMLTFVYANCTTVCPVANAVLQMIDEELERRGDHKMRLISVSIDPDTDTPEKLAALAEELGAGPRWRFVTGQRKAMDQAVRSMGARPDAITEHEPMFLVRGANGKEFVRVLGLPGPERLLSLAGMEGD